MVRFLISTAFLTASNAVGLIVANLLLDDMTMSASGFIIALAIFTLASAVARPFIMKLALTNFEALMGGTALISTLIALIITVAVSDALDINGTSTWLIATTLVWLVSVLAGLVLPLLILKRGAEKVKDNRNNIKTFG
jgi:hypothetical protein